MTQSYKMDSLDEVNPSPCISPNLTIISCPKGYIQNPLLPFCIDKSILGILPYVYRHQKMFKFLTKLLTQFLFIEEPIKILVFQAYLKLDQMTI